MNCKQDLEDFAGVDVNVLERQLLLAAFAALELADRVLDLCSKQIVSRAAQRLS
jgi:hypothetical protein